MIKILHLNNLEEKFPHEISAGEAQESLARSLMSKPKLLLIDEPFSNIDQSLKGELQANIKKLLKELKITTLWLAHDFMKPFIWEINVGLF